MSLGLKDISKELRLQDTSHWGIINSDSLRVIEFIQYINERDSLDFSIRYSFVELIIASMNDAILEGNTNCNIHGMFYEYIKPYLSDDSYSPVIPYWIRIKSNDEFPVGFLLVKYKKEDQSPSLERNG